MNKKAVTLPAREFDRLIGALIGRGYVVLAPTIRAEAIAFAPIVKADDLPIGWTVDQSPASYRLRRRDDDLYFAYAVGHDSAKRWLFPPRRTLWRIKKSGTGLEFEPSDPLPQKTAILGLRPCDLRAIVIQDRIFTQGRYIDPYYRSMRDRLLLIAVDCSEPAGTCFCTSVDGSPGAEGVFDLRLTELLDNHGHRFLIIAGSPEGQDILDELNLGESPMRDIKAREQLLQEAEARISKRLDTSGLQELLYANAENPRWQETADRCLSCGNCTMSCPTCFCWNMEDATDLDGRDVRRDRVWDSCFNEAFTFVHGGSVRVSTMSRYRHWITHKLAAWIEQFGTIGCVGCGRCIVWCPAGIDITEEAAAIRAKPIDRAEALIDS